MVFEAVKILPQFFTHKGVFILVFNCKMCGANLEITEGMRICKCSYCDSYQTVPDISSENKLRLFSKANSLRFECQFDKSAEAYRDITEIFPEEAEAYWGLCLCRYGIEYVDDPESHKKIPTCHRTDFNRIFHTSEYNNALKYADEMMKVLYEKEAEKIDCIQQNIISISAQEKPFDIFICYKDTDLNGQKTKEYGIARNIYEKLTECGFKVFFADVTLSQKLGTEFEPYIFSAINSSQVMICIGTALHNFNAVWVRNEWSRFIDLMRNDSSRVLIPCFKDMEISMLPKELQGFQAQDMSQENACEKVISSVKEIMSVTSDTKNQLKTLFDRYEQQLKSQLSKIHEYEAEKHQQAIYEKINARKLYRKEYQPLGSPVGLCIVIAIFISTIIYGITQKEILLVISFLIVFCTMLAIIMPKIIRKNKIAKDNLTRRLSYDETAPDYQTALKSNVLWKEELIDKYNKEYLSLRKIMQIMLVNSVLIMFPAKITNLFLDTIEYIPIYFVWLTVSSVFYGWLIFMHNKKLKKELAEKINGSQQ